MEGGTMVENAATNWSGMRAAATASLLNLMEALSDEGAEDRLLVVTYIDTKRTLARAFEAFAREAFSNPSVLAETTVLIETAMRASYSEIPGKYLRVRGFGRVHEMLLAYLMGRVGQEVSADELRVLTGDAVHTERRARDLRDLGFRLTAHEQGGTQVYVLADRVPDVRFAVELLVTKNLRADPALNEQTATAMLAKTRDFEGPQK
jgi:hypothetical protein